jgi:hypothetical protein
VLDSNGEHRSFIMGGTSIYLHIHQKGNHLMSGNQATGNHTPSPADNIKIFSNVSFSHKITPPLAANGRSMGSSFLGVTVNERVDHGLGRILPFTPNHDGSIKHQKQHFQSLLLIIEAKNELSFSHALP